MGVFSLLCSLHKLLVPEDKDFLIPIRKNLTTNKIICILCIFRPPNFSTNNFFKSCPLLILLRVHFHTLWSLVQDNQEEMFNTVGAGRGRQPGGERRGRVPALLPPLPYWLPQGELIQVRSWLISFKEVFKQIYLRKKSSYLTCTCT